MLCTQGVYKWACIIGLQLHIPLQNLTINKLRLQGGKTYVLRGVTDDDASDWVRRIEGSIGLRCAMRICNAGLVDWPTMWAQVAFCRASQLVICVTCRYNPYKYSKQAATADASATDGEQLPEAEAGQLPPQPRSPLAAPGEPATIWHANEAAEDVAGEGPDADQLSQIRAAPLGASDDGDDRSVSQLAEEPDETDWQQVADAVRDGDSRPTRTYGGRDGGGRRSDNRTGGDASSHSGDDGKGVDDQAAIVYRDSDGATFEDTLEEGFSADGSLAAENARIWEAPAKQSVVPGTMTEPLDGTGNDDVLEAAEEVVAAARQYQQPPGAAVVASQQPRATTDDTALPLQVCTARNCHAVRACHNWSLGIPSDIPLQDGKHSIAYRVISICCALGMQEHIGAVLTRVRSLMSDVNSFKTQQAALAAANEAGGTLRANGDRINGCESDGSGGKQPEQIAAAWSEYQDGAAARALLQQWQAQQNSSKGGNGMPAAFTPTQVSCRDAAQTCMDLASSMVCAKHERVTALQATGIHLSPLWMQ